MRSPFRSGWLTVALLALLLVLPLLRHGPSCGHDFGFHMQSWMDAADQLRHGTLFPHWAYSPAFNAGEPRFVFYPPLSWLLGALLWLTLPHALVPAAFTFLALSLAGWAMYALARRFTTETGALVAAALYLANPYLLFTAFERTAYAELLAAAWMPWLLRGALADQPGILAIAAPLALLWLTNAPAAVMGTYALSLVLTLRLGWQWFAARRAGASASSQAQTAWAFAKRGAGGLLLGLVLPDFYLLPAAWERRDVQVAMAIIPNMRVEDNFLFGHTGYGPHDAVLHTASLVALSLMGLTAAALIAGAPRLRRAHPGLRTRWSILAILAFAIVFLVLPFTLPLWHHLPELAFLQFPWRWLAVLGCVFGAAVALAIGPWRPRPIATLLLTGALAAGAGFLAQLPFRQGCEAHELPADRAALFATHHGVGPTDEYTPADADNDQLRWDDPAWWLTTDPNAPAANTVPNPAATIPDYDEPPPLDQTVSGRAPTALHLNLKAPEDLVLNLRDYPAWIVTVNGARPTHLQRDDGLIALPLKAGPADIAIRWRTLPDVWLGDALSACGLAVAAAVRWRSRKIEPEP